MLKQFDELETKRQDTRLGIPREEGEALYTFIKEHKIKRVVETGIAWGFTSYYILAALPEDGHLYSLEISNTIYSGIVVPKEWHNRWTRIYGPTQETLKPFFVDHKDIDLFFHDSCHDFITQMFEYKMALGFVSYIGSHDITLRGPPYAWANFIADTKAKILIKKGQLGIADLKAER